MDRFDNYYMAIAKDAGGIEGLLQTFFSFLYRRTDFYYEAEPNDKMGFPPQANEKMLISIFMHFRNEHYKKFPKKSVEEYKAKLEALRANKKAQELAAPAPKEGDKDGKSTSDAKNTESKGETAGDKDPKTSGEKKDDENKVSAPLEKKEDKYNDIR